MIERLASAGRTTAEMATAARRGPYIMIRIATFATCAYQA
jgi:hypothetical protein